MRKLEGPVFLFLAFTLAGTSVISARIVSGMLGTFIIAAASLFFALLLLLPLCLKKLIRVIGSLSFKDILLLVTQAVFGILLFRMCLLYGLLFTSAGEAGILTGATPAFTALFAILILKEAPGIRKLAGNLLVLGAAFSESVFNILSRVTSVRPKRDLENSLNPLVQTTAVTAAAFLLCLAPALLDPSLKNLSALGVKEWLALIWYGAVVTAAAFICWYAGIKRCAAITAAAFSGMMPFTSLLLCVIILGERAGWQQWAGGALIIAGMLLIGSGALRIREKQYQSAEKAGVGKDA